MAQPVRCDICGKLFSSSYVNSHKRLAHRTAEASGLNEAAAARKIVRLFKALSAAGQKKLAANLNVIAGKSK